MALSRPPPHAVFRAHPAAESRLRIPRGTGPTQPLTRPSMLDSAQPGEPTAVTLRVSCDRGGDGDARFPACAPPGVAGYSAGSIPFRNLNLHTPLQSATGSADPFQRGSPNHNRREAVPGWSYLTARLKITQTSLAYSQNPSIIATAGKPGQRLEETFSRSFAVSPSPTAPGPGVKALKCWSPSNRSANLGGFILRCLGVLKCLLRLPAWEGPCLPSSQAHPTAGPVARPSWPT